jgi:hypothetical protein
MLKDVDADVTINVGDRFFRGHRDVPVALSNVLEDQLFGVTKESNTECLKIEEMEPSVRSWFVDNEQSVAAIRTCSTPPILRPRGN